MTACSAGRMSATRCAFLIPGPPPCATLCPPSWLSDRCQARTPSLAAAAATVPCASSRGAPRESWTTWTSAQRRPGRPPRALATASLAAKNPASESGLALRSPSANSRVDSDGVRGAPLPAREMSAMSTPMPTITCQACHGPPLGAALAGFTARRVSNLSARDLYPGEPDPPVGPWEPWPCAGRCTGTRFAATRAWARTELWSEVKPGSLYAAIRRLRAEGLIEPVRTEQQGNLRPHRVCHHRGGAQGTAGAAGRGAPRGDAAPGPG